MRTRAVREGSVGLLVIFGLGLVTSLIFWVRGFNFGGKSYTLQVELVDALGLNIGSPVKFRGVKVGHITQMHPQTEQVIVDVKITSGSVLIPRQTKVETSQSGFVGQAALEFRPAELDLQATALEDLSPFAPDCDPRLILCQGDRLEGVSGNNLEELIRATMQIANQLGGTDLKATLNNLSQAAVDVSQLSKDTKVALRDVSLTARSVRQLSVKTQRQLQRFGTAADSVTAAAQQVNQLGSEVNTLVRVNRGTLVTSLNNLQEASQELKGVVNGLSPVISRVHKGQLLDNLEQLAANGAEVSQTLNTLTTAINTPSTMSELTETVDSAKQTLQNVQKITSDLEEITGNPEFRQNLIRLINGLGKLLSSSQDLEQQIQAVQDPMVTPIENAPSFPDQPSIPQYGYTAPVAE
ncbi:MlaD family protein [Acaryochloris sp. IP29b_bin.148]|uniref:MlaD family protein n=1 Tax=Acaryochloris sp. IP29b_bin.148 TaxID=2969218 RepID=UPI002638A3E1|nr:MlaD family protein [Acaryochloris sp. IP29b_bin.148]